MSQKTGVAPVCAMEFAAAHEVERREHDLVARTDSGCEQCEVQCGGPVRHRQGVLDADELGELALELLDAGPHAPPARVDHFIDNPSELFVDEHVGQGHRP